MNKHVLAGIEMKNPVPGRFWTFRGLFNPFAKIPIECICY